MFWHLYFAHLLADFPLQPRWLVAAKDRMWALGLHAVLHFLTALLIVGDVRWRILIPLLVLGLVHFAIDLVKYRLALSRPDWVTVPYFLDQLVHLLSILLLAGWVGSILGDAAVQRPPAWLLYAAGYLAVTHVWFVTEKVLTRPGSGYRKELEAELWPRMASRAVMLSLFLVLGSGQEAFGLLAIAWLPYKARSHRLRALLTDLAVAILVAALVRSATLTFAAGT